MGGQGPVYQFASMSSVREVCTPSPHVTVWLLSMLRALGCDIQDFEESCGKKNKKIKAFERRAIDFGINEKSSCMKCHCENELFSAGICVEFGKAFKRTCKTDLKFC